MQPTLNMIGAGVSGIGVMATSAWAHVATADIGIAPSLLGPTAALALMWYFLQREIKANEAHNKQARELYAQAIEREEKHQELLRRFADHLERQDQ